MKGKTFCKRDYNEVIKSTRTYYDEYSENYVKFYESWLKKEGAFSDFKYREGYETVVEFLANTASQEKESLTLAVELENGQPCWQKKA